MTLEIARDIVMSEYKNASLQYQQIGYINKHDEFTIVNMYPDSEQPEEIGPTCFTEAEAWIAAAMRVLVKRHREGKVLTKIPR
jgi:hypothetical protein